MCANGRIVHDNGWYSKNFLISDTYSEPPYPSNIQNFIYYVYIYYPENLVSSDSISAANLPTVILLPLNLIQAIMNIRVSKE